MKWGNAFRKIPNTTMWVQRTILEFTYSPAIVTTAAERLRAFTAIVALTEYFTIRAFIHVYVQSFIKIDTTVPELQRGHRQTFTLFRENKKSLKKHQFKMVDSLALKSLQRQSLIVWKYVRPYVTPCISGTSLPRVMRFVCVSKVLGLWIGSLPQQFLLVLAKCYMNWKFLQIDSACIISYDLSYLEATFLLRFLSHYKRDWWTLIIGTTLNLHACWRFLGCCIENALFLWNETHS